jgi:hypothetical protein
MLTILKKFTFFALFVLTVMQLNGCATTTALLEGGAESMNPTVMAALDSFESAAMAIKLSNRVLLESPISEQDVWPSKLSGAPTGASIFKMGLSLAGSTQGVTIPTELDPETGFPRPTSALYSFLKDRNQILNNECNKTDVKYFKNKPKSNDCPLGKRKKDGTSDDNVYRNPLVAYGVVTANKQEILAMQHDVENTAKGFRTCNAFIHKTTQETDQKVIKASCPDPALKGEDLEKKLASKVKDSKEAKAEAEKTYGKLANKVYTASVAGADFTAAAVTKITFAIVNGIRALPNIKNEFAGLKGAYNVAVIIPRAKNVFKSLGVYKDHLGFQWTAYKTMYQQIKGTYEIKDDEPTKQALQRIKAVEVAMADLEPKLNLALAGALVQFSATDVERLNTLAAMFPTNHELERTLFAALKE